MQASNPRSTFGRCAPLVGTLPWSTVPSLTVAPRRSPLACDSWRAGCSTVTSSRSSGHTATRTLIITASQTARLTPKCASAADGQPRDTVGSRVTRQAPRHRGRRRRGRRIRWPLRKVRPIFLLASDFFLFTLSSHLLVSPLHLLMTGTTSPACSSSNTRAAVTSNAASTSYFLLLNSFLLYTSHFLHVLTSSSFILPSSFFHLPFSSYFSLLTSYTSDF